MSDETAPEINIDERKVIARVLSGEKDEYRHLVRAYQDQIYTMIRRQVGDEQMSKDLTQEVMLRAYLNLSQFRFKSRYSTWLIRIALNLTNSYFASKQYKRLARTAALDGEGCQRFCSGDETAADGGETVEKLRACIGALQPRYREALVLCSFENKSYVEAACILEVPVGTVCSRINMARSLLRKKLQRTQP